MDYVNLGKTGLQISRVGFGGIPIQKIDRKAANALMDSLIEHGINYIDTARGYTVSEELIGSGIAGRRNKFVLATKSMGRKAPAMAKDIETSLKNLQTDYIDLYQIHNPSLKQLDVVVGEGGALDALIEAKKSGKIGHIGITAHALEVFERALALDWVETIMFPYNIVEDQCKNLLPECKKRGKGFIAMKPLAGGAIEDSETALRFLAVNPLVTVMIPGMYKPGEIKQNAAAGNDTSPLTENELKRIEHIRSSLTGNFCRRCNYCAPCTVGINIPSVFVFAGYLERYGLENWAKERYNTLPVKASACIGCGKCESRCPYGLPIRRMLKKCAEEFEK